MHLTQVATVLVARHRCCHLVNNAQYVDCLLVWVLPTMSPKCPSHGGSGPYLITEVLQRRLKWHFDQFSCFCKEHRHTVTVSCILCYAYWCWLKIHQVSKSPSILGRHKVQLRLQMFTVGDSRVQLFVIIFTWSLPLLQQSTQFARLSYNKADSTSPGKPVSYTFNKSMFSYLHALKTWHCPHLLLHGMLRPCAAAAPAAQQSIDISY